MIRIWEHAGGAVSITHYHPDHDTPEGRAAVHAKLLMRPEFAGVVVAADVADEAALVALLPAPNPGLTSGPPSFTPQPASRRRFRDAWRWGGNAVVEDIPECRRIRMREIHGERDRRSEEAHIRAHTETGVQHPTWQAYQQQLAVMDCDVSNLTTAAAIAAYEPPWPQEPA